MIECLVRLVPNHHVNLANLRYVLETVGGVCDDDACSQEVLLVLLLCRAREPANLIVRVAIFKQVGVELLHQLDVGDINQRSETLVWEELPLEGVYEIGYDEGLARTSRGLYEASPISLQDYSPYCVFLVWAHNPHLWVVRINGSVKGNVVNLEVVVVNLEFGHLPCKWHKVIVNVGLGVRSNHHHLACGHLHRVQLKVRHDEVQHLKEQTRWEIAKWGHRVLVHGIPSPSEET